MTLGEVQRLCDGVWQHGAGLPSSRSRMLAASDPWMRLSTVFRAGKQPSARRGAQEGGHDEGNPHDYPDPRTTTVHLNQHLGDQVICGVVKMPGQPSQIACGLPIGWESKTRNPYILPAFQMPVESPSDHKAKDNNGAVAMAAIEESSKIRQQGLGMLKRFLVPTPGTATADKDVFLQSFDATGVRKVGGKPDLGRAADALAAKDEHQAALDMVGGLPDVL